MIEIIVFLYVIIVVRVFNLLEKVGLGLKDFLIVLKVVRKFVGI